MSVPEGGVEPIAVVGLSGRLVGHSVDSPPAGAHEDAVDARYIDADALGLSAREAQVVAPPQRVSLECAWELFESSAYDPNRYKERIGIYASVAADDRYLTRHLLPHPPLLRSFSDSELELLTSPDLPLLWLSHRLNLRGPVVCLAPGECASTAALHVACQSLRDRECEMAIAGGIGFLERSGDGFDSREAAHEWRAGLVLLKRLSSAEADRDAIHAVIRGSAFSREDSETGDGAAAGPGGPAHTAADCARRAGVEPGTVSYIELTGTRAEGGRIAATLSAVFGPGTSLHRNQLAGPDRKDMGSIKGVAGVIEVTQALMKRVVPCQPDPGRWLETGPGRRAVVIDIGPVGASAHVVLEEAPAVVESGSSRSSHLLRISAKSAPALEMLAARLRNYLSDHREISLADVAFSLDTGRRPFGYRKAVVCRSVTDALETLCHEEEHKVDSGFAASNNRPVVFMFPGAGAHHSGMGRGLYEAEPIFRDEFDRCCDIMASQEGIDLRSAVYPDDPKAALDQPVPVLAGLFSLEYSLACLWIQLSVHPESMIGHSLGEYVAACLAGVFTLEDGLKLVTFRGRLFETVPVGAMLSVSLGESEVVPYLNGDLSLAGINAPAACVVSGSEEAIRELQEKLSSRDIETRLLRVGRAGHSQFVDPILDEFTRFVGTLRLNRPRIPYLSNYTGTWTKDEDAVDPGYWAAHLRHTVRFAQGIDALLLAPERLFLEVGPGRTLSSLARQHPRAGERVILSSMRHVRDSQSDLEVFQRALGRLWIGGTHIDAGALYRDERRRRLALPTYPFERKRHWVDAGETPEKESLPATYTPDPECVEPQNEIERATARIWKDVLGVPAVSVERSFGDSGGDERLLRMARDRMALEFGVVTDERFSLQSTIAQMADLVTERALEKLPDEELTKALADLDLPPL
jgi:acyl transferase domain-containing protein